MAVGAVERRFYLELLSVLGLEPAALPEQHDAARWPELRQIIGDRFLTRTRDAWEAAFAGTDACVSPVLDMAECPSHPLARDRGMFLHDNGVTEPRPAPRFSATPLVPPAPPPDAFATTATTLADWGITADRIAALAAAGVVPG
jgi:alpha-methylacyl-CoA racemase